VVDGFPFEGALVVEVEVFQGFAGGEAGAFSARARNAISDVTLRLVVLAAITPPRPANGS
jgi:hypothetical protein